MKEERIFGQVLRELRLKKELSQEALAFEAKLQRNYVSLLERGLNSATLKTLYKLAPVLELRPSEMLALVESRLHKSPAERGAKKK